MAIPRIFAISPPPGSAIASWYAGADLLDSYAVSLPAGPLPGAHALARLMLERPPAWIAFLMSVRDGVMSRLGVKKSSAIRHASDGRDRISFFPVLSNAADEVVLGADDCHLNFRTAVAVLSGADGHLLVCTTAVRCHNRLGRLYIGTIRPFHVAIVRAGLRRAGDRLRAGVTTLTVPPVAPPAQIG